MVLWILGNAACDVGALGETFDWPVPVTMMLVFFRKKEIKLLLH